MKTIACSLLTLCVGLSWPQGQDVVEVRDASGIVRTRLGSLENGASGLEILDAQGVRRIAVVLESGGVATVALTDKAGLARVRLTADATSSSLLLSAGPDRQIEATCSDAKQEVQVRRDGKPLLTLTTDDGEGSELRLASSGKDGLEGGSVRLRAEPDKANLLLGAGADNVAFVACDLAGNSEMRLKSASGRVGMYSRKTEGGMAYMVNSANEPIVTLQADPSKGSGLRITRPGGVDAIRLGCKANGEVVEEYLDPKGEAIRKEHGK